MRLLPSASVGPAVGDFRACFDAVIETDVLEMDGTPGAERAAAQAFQRMTKAANTGSAIAFRCARGVSGAPNATSLPCPLAARTSRRS